MVRKKPVRTSYELEAEHAESLKAIAEELGYFQVRGAGAGKLPNVSALLRALAEADKDKMVAVLRKAGIEKKQAIVQ